MGGPSRTHQSLVAQRASGDRNPDGSAPLRLVARRPLKFDHGIESSAQDRHADGDGSNGMASEMSAGMGEQPMAAPAMRPQVNGGGHLYTQTNESQNCVIHYLRAPDGTITESDRIPTGGAGSAGYNPIVSRESTPQSPSRAPAA
jgi:hypothetical protein